MKTKQKKSTVLHISYDELQASLAHLNGGMDSMGTGELGTVYGASVVFPPPKFISALRAATHISIHSEFPHEDPSCERENPACEFESYYAATNLEEMSEFPFSELSDDKTGACATFVEQARYLKFLNEMLRRFPAGSKWEFFAPIHRLFQAFNDDCEVHLEKLRSKAGRNSLRIQ